jgi:serine/threonine protein phosphatase PrpC/LysM repeat protein
MNRIKFKIAAKTDVGLERSNNEDNFQASSDLLVTPMRWVNNEICQLGEKGALLVVADGMGGMNAGEVASQIAIDTVREEFAQTNITPEITKSRYTIEKFMNEVVIKADAKIKDVSKKRPETRGMGTTIVIAWLYDGSLYVSWCGDSRAYVFNPDNGLHRLTKDHSYVQQLVDAGKLTEDEAFDFPESNIITRCLCDAKQKAQPECLDKPYPVCDNDIILLCTDGLCGMIRDCEIQNVMNSFTKDMTVLTDNLVQAALNASGADNCTVCLCQILSGGKKSVDNYFAEKTSKSLVNKCDKLLGNSHRTLKLSLLCIAFLCLGGMISWPLFTRYSTKVDVIAKDSINVVRDSLQNTHDNEGSNAIEDDSNKEPQSVGKKNEIPEKGSIDITNKLNINVPRTKDAQNSDDKSQAIGLTLNKAKEDNPEEEVTEVERQVIEVTVEQGQTAYGIARKHNMHRPELEKLNPGIDLDKVHPGDKIKVYKK